MKLRTARELLCEEMATSKESKRRPAETYPELLGTRTRGVVIRRLKKASRPREGGLSNVERPFCKKRGSGQTFLARTLEQMTEKVGDKDVEELLTLGDSWHVER